jgi:hypothetical protein
MILRTLGCVVGNFTITPSDGDVAVGATPLRVEFASEHGAFLCIKMREAPEAPVTCSMECSGADQVTASHYVHNMGNSRWVSAIRCDASGSILNMAQSRTFASPGTVNILVAERNF